MGGGEIRGGNRKNHWQWEKKVEGVGVSGFFFFQTRTGRSPKNRELIFDDRLILGLEKLKRVANI